MACVPSDIWYVIITEFVASTDLGACLLVSREWKAFVLRRLDTEDARSNARMGRLWCEAYLDRAHDALFESIGINIREKVSRSVIRTVAAAAGAPLSVRKVHSLRANPVSIEARRGDGKTHAVAAAAALIVARCPGVYVRVDTRPSRRTCLHMLQLVCTRTRCLSAMEGNSKVDVSPLCGAYAIVVRFTDGGASVVVVGMSPEVVTAPQHAKDAAVWSSVSRFDLLLRDIAQPCWEDLAGPAFAAALRFWELPCALTVSVGTPTAVYGPGGSARDPTL